MDKYNILIAEDDKEIARSIGIYLKNENFNIFYAYDGLEALDIFKNEKILENIETLRKIGIKYD